MNHPRICVVCKMPIDGEPLYLTGSLDSNGFGAVYFVHKSTNECHSAADKEQGLRTPADEERRIRASLHELDEAIRMAGGAQDEGALGRLLAERRDLASKLHGRSHTELT